VTENCGNLFESQEDLEALVRILGSLWRVYYVKKRAELDARGIEEGCLHVEDEHLHEEMRVVDSLIESAILRQFSVHSMACVGTDGYCSFYVVPEGNHGWHIHVKVKGENNGSYGMDGTPFSQNAEVEKQVSDRVRVWISDPKNLKKAEDWVEKYESRDCVQNNYAANMQPFFSDFFKYVSEDWNPPEWWYK
jgi:hypothetical protein